jgi:hypothetical protein
MSTEGYALPAPQGSTIMPRSLACLFGLAVLTLLAISTATQAQDYFDQQKKSLDVEAQKLVSDATTALETSRTMEKTDAAAAKTLLEKRLREVTDSSSLDDKQRNDLRKKLLDRIRDVNGTLALHKGDDSKSKLDADKMARDDKNKGDSTNKSLYEQSKSKIEGTKKTVDTYGDLKTRMNKNATDIALDAEKTFSKQTEERFTKYFEERAKKRTDQKLTSEETALLKVLNSTISVDFKDASLKEVLEFLDAKSDGKLNIFLDQSSIKEAGVDYESKVNFKGKSMKVRTLLKKVFGDLGLTWAIKDAAVQVITPDKIKDFMVSRAYPVGDLISPVANNRMPMWLQKQYMYNQAQQLMQTIVSMIEPNSWQGTSEKGYGTISYNEATMSIVVNHTAEMHYMLGGGLSR